MAELIEIKKPKGKISNEPTSGVKECEERVNIPPLQISDSSCDVDKDLSFMIKFRHDVLNHNREPDEEDEADDEESFSCDELNNLRQNGQRELNKNFNVNWNDALTTKFAHLLDTGAFTDVKFKVGEGVERVERRAHKIILALSSPVFMKMFYGSLRSESLIDIPDVDAQSFDALLQYIYKSGKLTNTDPQDTIGVLYVAHKYNIEGLEALCEEKLTSSISPMNVFHTEVVADMYQLMELKAKCWRFIQDHTETVLSLRLESVGYNKMFKILEDDHLNIDELELFEIVMRWAENECRMSDLAPNVLNKLNKLGRNIFLIRFPTMNSADFANKVVPTGILNSDQVAKVLTYICASCDKKKDISLEFSTKPRQPFEKTSSSSITSSYKQHQQLLTNNVVVESSTASPSPDQNPISNESGEWDSPPDFNHQDVYYDWFNEHDLVSSVVADPDPEVGGSNNNHNNNNNQNIVMEGEESEESSLIRNPFHFPGVRAVNRNRRPSQGPPTSGKYRYTLTAAAAAARRDLKQFYLGINGISNSNSSESSSIIMEPETQQQPLPVPLVLRQDCLLEQRNDLTQHYDNNYRSLRNNANIRGRRSNRGRSRK